MLEDRLEYQSKIGSSGPWVVGDKMTIADLASFAWINWAEWAGVEVEQFKQLKAWLDRINARPAIQKGLDVPEPFEMKKKMQSKVRCRTYGVRQAQNADTRHRRARKNIRRCIANGL